MHIYKAGCFRSEIDWSVALYDQAISIWLSSSFGGTVLLILHCSLVATDMAVVSIWSEQPHYKHQGEGNCYETGKYIAKTIVDR